MAAAEPIIAVIGTTGSGKSTFIQALTGSQDCEVGHSLRSQTSHIATYPLAIATASGGTVIQLADTPGFDDTLRTDYEILEELIRWLKADDAAEARSLAGIVYMLPINQERLLRGSNRKMVRVVRRLLGPDCFRMVLLVTSFWNEVDPAVGQAREAELLAAEDGWAPFREGGAAVERLGRDCARFGPVLARMAARREPGPRLLVQEEMRAGKELGETMAALALDEDEGAARREARRLVEEEVRAKEAEKAEARRKAVEKEREERMREVLEREQEEKRRVQRQLEEQERKHRIQMERTRRELEEQKKREAAVRAKLEQQRVEAEKRSRQQAIEAMEEDAAVQYRCSKIQERRVHAAVDALRFVLHSGGYPQPVWGIKPRGKGMMGVGHRGQTLPDHYSIARNGMSIWCDYCRVSVGQAVSYLCFHCDMRICAGCQRVGRGCLNRAHVLVKDTYWQSRPSNCTRVRRPDAALRCDGYRCNKPISGFYLHCCCNGAELDFCETCILARGARCRNASHQLYWGVRPLVMDTLSSSALGDKGTRYPQTTSQVPDHTMQTWLNASTRPLPLSRAFARIRKIDGEINSVLEAQRNGTVTIRLQSKSFPSSRAVHVSIANLRAGTWSYCDYCLAPTTAKPHYECPADHPKLGYNGGGGLVLCNTCHTSGIRCPELHTMVFKSSVTMLGSCRRDLQEPMHLVCDICRKDMIQETYFHCCREGDDTDICLSCVLKGWACPNVTGDHVLKMHHLVAC